MNDAAFIGIRLTQNLLMRADTLLANPAKLAKHGPWCILLGIGHPQERLDHGPKTFGDFTTIRTLGDHVLAQKRMPPVVLGNHVPVHVPRADYRAVTIAHEFDGPAQCGVRSFPDIAEE
jgi:hypothetical protein